MLIEFYIKTRICSAKLPLLMQGPDTVCHGSVVCVIISLILKKIWAVSPSFVKHILDQGWYKSSNSEWKFGLYCNKTLKMISLNLYFSHKDLFFSFEICIFDMSISFKMFCVLHILHLYSFLFYIFSLHEFSICSTKCNDTLLEGYFEWKYLQQLHELPSKLV